MLDIELLISQNKSLLSQNISLQSDLIRYNKIIKNMALVIVDLTEEKTGKETISINDLIESFKKNV